MNEVNDLSQWLKLLVKASHRTPVLVLAVLGLSEIIGAAFVGGYWQALLLQVGIVLILISPIVVTERIAVTEEVKELREQVARLSEAPQEERARIQKIEQLFCPETNYTSEDLLTLLKASMNERAVTRCGVAVPISAGNYDTLLGITLDPDVGEEGVYFQPRYVIDAQTEIKSRILYEYDSKQAMWAIMWRPPLDPDNEPTVSAMLMGIRNELLEKNRHPQSELDFEEICARFKRALTLRLDARQPGGEYRTGLGSVIALVGPDLAVTAEGIEHISDTTTKTLDKFSVWHRAGLPNRIPNQRARERRTMEKLNKRQIRESGLADHPDFDTAISVLRTLYMSTFLWPIIVKPKR